MNRKQIVCTRYAPSPTGALHVGGARTALFNYLYAKKHNGKFILRIEDTDAARNVADGHLEIENALKALNIFPDESFSSPGQAGPYIQSQKLGRYREICQRLIKEGKAYRCFCTDEELAQARRTAQEERTTPKYNGRCRSLSAETVEAYLRIRRSFAVRLRADFLREYSWRDLVRGEITIPSSSMGDFIIMRSNDLPTYNFAVAVDDLDMGITCVLRGEEHIPNTCYQLATYHALDSAERIPEFGHLSIIVDADKKKLSKRSEDEAHFVTSLVAKGYLPEAIVNFLALLGWSHGSRELFTFEELVNHFDISSLNRAPAYFDLDKLNWINHRYFQAMTPEAFWNFVMPIFTVNLGEHERNKKSFALANQANIHYASQLNELALAFYGKKRLTKEMVKVLSGSRELIKLALERFPGPSEEWDKVTILSYLKQVSQISRLKGRKFYQPLRIAFSMQYEGMELFNVMQCLGREEIENNLRGSWKRIENEKS